MVDHKAIIDAERHEAKGASTAAIGQVLSATGSGTTTFATPSTLVNTITNVELSQGSVSAQTPSALDTALQVEFGALASGTNVSLATNGTITINTNGYYLLTVNLNFGRTSGAGEAYLFARILVNDAPTGFVEGIKLPDGNVTIPFQANLESYFLAGTTIKLQVIRDSLGINNGGLVVLDPVTAGWATSPSAWIRIRKVQGAN